MWGLGVLIPLLGAGALRLSQEPKEVQVTEGDEVALECHVLVAEPWDLLRLEWVRDGGRGVLCATRLRPAGPAPPDSCPHHDPRLNLTWHPPRATLSLRRVRGDDAGRYVCRVTLEIPRHCTATGNGTLLSVSAAAADGGHLRGLAGALAGGLGGTALILALLLLGRRSCRRRSDTGIYQNVLPRSPWTPEKLLLPTPAMKNNMYQEGL